MPQPLTTATMLAALLIALAVQAVNAGDEGLYFPTQEPEPWQTVTPEQAGADPERIEQALTYAKEHGSKGVVILYRGRILAERYWAGHDKTTPHPAYSASKSITSTLVGMAIQDQHLTGVDQPVAEVITEWHGSKDHEPITIHHLLSLTPGLEGGRKVFFKGLVSRDERAFVTALPVTHKPGSQWEYHNSAYRLLLPLIEEATGESLPDYTEKKLLKPLGMTHTTWATKRRAEDQYTFLNTTPRDAARYGLLILATGQWHDRQLISRDWIERATKPANPEVNPSYGYLWWLNGGDHFYLPLRPVKRRGMIFPDCPPDTIAALGKDDQKIYVVPSLQLVVTRFGDAADKTSPAVSAFDNEFLGMICDSFDKEPE